jgi:hypothetical protein
MENLKSLEESKFNSDFSRYYNDTDDKILYAEASSQNLLKDFENKSLTMTSFLVFLFLMSYVGTYAYFNVLFFISNWMGALLLLTAVFNVHVLFLSYFTKFLEKYSKLVKYSLIGLLLLTRISFIIFSTNARETSINQKITMQSILFIFFMACILYYRFYHNKIVRDISEHLIKKESINDLQMKYTKNLIDKMMCLFFSFRENEFLFVNNSAKNFMENKINLNKESKCKEEMSKYGDYNMEIGLSPERKKTGSKKFIKI